MNDLIEFQQYEDNLKLALTEPVIDMEEMAANYSFDMSKVEGMWPGEEPIEQLLNMLKKRGKALLFCCALRILE